MFIFKLLILFFLVALAVGLLRIYRFIHTISDQAKQIRDSAEKRSKRQNGNHRTYGDDETVVDQRDPDDANRKIISKEDGEYVDFTEENGNAEQK